MRTAPAVARTLARASARRAFLKSILGNRIANASDFHEPLDARQIALLKDVAASWTGALPRGSRPRIVLSDACRNHGTCAAVCPTSALRSYSAQAVGGLAFQPATCIGCGVCEVVCPEGALEIQAAPTVDVAAAPEAAAARSSLVLSRHVLRECARCDNAFVESGDEELCPACRKDVSLFANAFPIRSDAA